MKINKNMLKYNCKGGVKMAIPVRWQLKNDVCEAYSVKNQTSSSLHGHYHFLLTLVTRGEGVQTLNGEEVCFSPGQLFILSPADFHKNTLKPGQSYDYYGVKFPYELLTKRLIGLCSLDKFPLTKKLSERAFVVAKEIFERLIEEFECGKDRLANQIYIETMVEQLLIIAIREYSGDESSVQSVFLNRALGYLYSHFYENITVNDAAEFMGYTTNYFNTVFKNSLGSPFGKYLSELRLTYASNLLKSCDLTITEIAFESGFENSAHFSRRFHEKFGLSPKEYRDKNG